MIHRDFDFVVAHELYGLDLEEFIEKFREIIYEEPENLTKLLDAHRRLIETTMEDVDPKERNKAALKCIAGYCVLADYDCDGSLTSFSSEDDFYFLAPFYDDPKRYGRAMAALSSHLGLEGEVLGEFVLGDYTLH